MVLGKYKRFGGKTYTNEGGTTSESKAKKVAAGLRTIGKLARVYHVPGTNTYYVYSR